MLAMAALYGFHEQLSVLITIDNHYQASDINEALVLASENGYSDIVRTLLVWRGKNGDRADPRTIEIKCVLRNGHNDVFEILVAWRGSNGERINLDDYN